MYFWNITLNYDYYWQHEPFNSKNFSRNLSTSVLMCQQYFFAGDIVSIMSTGTPEEQAQKMKDGWRCMCSLIQVQELEFQRSHDGTIHASPKMTPSLPEPVANSPESSSFSIAPHTPQRPSNAQADCEDLDSRPVECRPLYTPLSQQPVMSKSRKLFVLHTSPRSPSDCWVPPLVGGLSSDDSYDSSLSPLPGLSFGQLGDIITDEEVQERLLEPGMAIELERMLLRKPEAVYYPMPNRRLVLQNTGEDGSETSRDIADDRIIRLRKVLDRQDPFKALWDLLLLKIRASAEVVLGKRASGNHDTFIYLNHRSDHTSFTKNPLTFGDRIPVEIKALIEDEWRRLKERYGEFTLVQEEQKRLVDKCLSILFHCQHAVASESLASLDDGVSLLQPAEQAFMELYAIAYGFRETVLSDLQSTDSASSNSNTSESASD